MVALLLCVTILFHSTSNTNQCEYSRRIGLKLHEALNPWLGKFFDYQYYQRAKALLECRYYSSLSTTYNIHNADFYKVVDFLGQIESSTEQPNGYRTLVSELISQGQGHTKEMLFLIYKIKRTSDQIFQARNFVEFNGYKDLENKFPRSFKVIVFKQCALIKSKDINELLYKSAIAGKQGDLVQTYKAGTYHNKSSEWYFEPHEENGRLFFYIINKHVDEGVLALGDAKSDAFGRYVEVQKRSARDNNQKWFVEPMSGGDFIIRNYNGPYLYASKGWCRDSFSDCLWNFRRFSYVLADNVLQRRLLTIYSNRRCGN